MQRAIKIHDAYLSLAFFKTYFILILVFSSGTRVLAMSYGYNLLFCFLNKLQITQTSHKNDLKMTLENNLSELQVNVFV